MGGTDVIEMVVIPQPVIFGGIVNEEMNIFGDFCGLNG